MSSATAHSDCTRAATTMAVIESPPRSKKCAERPIGLNPNASSHILAKVEFRKGVDGDWAGNVS